MNNWKISYASRALGLAGRVLSRALVFLISTVAFGTAAVSGQETPKQNVEFRWKSIKVGAMDFEIGPAFFAKTAVNAGEFGQPLFARDEARLSASVDGRAPVHLAVTGITKGPLKWFKNYQARAELSVQGQSRTFVLAGEDNGVREKRALAFEAGLPPVVKSFVDSTAPEALNVQNAWTHDTVDPLTVFEWMIFSAVKGQSCAKKFWIYDGKRRYAARTTALAGQPVEIKSEEARDSSCRLTLIGSNPNKGRHKNDGEGPSVLSLEVEARADYIHDNPGKTEVIFGEKVAAKDQSSWGALWPFAKDDRHIDFEFRICSNLHVIIKSVEMGAPIGKVIGATKARC
jgi:hypothetical protein